MKSLLNKLYRTVKFVVFMTATVILYNIVFFIFITLGAMDDLYFWLKEDKNEK